MKEAKDDYDGALILYENALAVYAKVLGREHTSIATNYSNIGEVKLAKGDYNGALETFQKWFAIRDKVLRWDHTLTVKACISIEMLKNAMCNHL